MKVKHVIQIIEQLCPPNYAEEFDNIGLLVGNSETTVKGILVTLDTLESVVDEAISKECNMIVSFHPIIFSGLKSLTGKTYVERTVMKAISYNIAIYSMHTALDNNINGVNAALANVLGLENRSILIPQKNTLRKLLTYVPEKQAPNLRNALFRAGAGHIGNYADCSFNLNGIGTFTPNEKANPTIGEAHKPQHENETQIGVIFPKHLQTTILKALRDNHPYEEIAYEIYHIENNHQHIGLGMIGFLPKPISETDFLELLKSKINPACIRHSELLGKKIKKIALLGGSGAFAIEKAKAEKADAFLTADLKYHDFFKAEKQILLTDVGHFESEQFTKKLLVEYLIEKIPNFAIVLSQTNTNPIKYY